jgi:4-dimethylallyltryptophan N-methyltransferase
LKNTPEICDLPHCLLLFGLTIGNFSRENAASFLKSITAHDRARSRKSEETDGRTSILLTIDSCKTPTKVLRAYNAEGVVPFALTALKYANVLLGKETGEAGENVPNIFETEEWHFLSQWNHVLSRHEASLIPKNKNIKLGAPLDAIVVGKDETVRFGCSYKYDGDQRRALFAAAGVEEVAVWSDDECDVAFYKLQYV